MARPMTEAGFIKRTTAILKKYEKANSKAWYWLNSLGRDAAKQNIAGGLVIDLETADYYAFYNAMPVVGDYTVPTYNQHTLEVYEASLEAYTQELIQAYEQR